MDYLSELTRINGQIQKIESNFADINFMSKAPAQVISLHKNKLFRFTDCLEMLLDKITEILNYIYKTIERISWHIQYLRENKYLADMKTSLNECLYDENYFNSVYDSMIDKKELAELCDLSSCFSSVNQF